MNFLFEQGQTVRLKHDPGKIGIVKECLERASKPYYKVHINGVTQTLPQNSIQLHEENESWESLLQNEQYGRPDDFRQQLTHIFLNGKLANLVYSMEATDTDFYAYQFKPVLSFLESPSNGLLIADEVGLGKTIEAGLVWTEIKARDNAKRLLILCPAMLREKWRDEFRVRFGEEAQILNAKDLLNEINLNIASNRNKSKVIVCSIEGLRPPKDWKDSEETGRKIQAELAKKLDSQSQEEPTFDMLIIDEAHYLRNRDTRSNELARLLTNVSENNLLLTATPINIQSEDLFQLLNLVDPDNFNDSKVFPNIIDANEPLYKARRKTLSQKTNGPDEILDNLKKAHSNPMLSNNQQLKNLLSEDISQYISSEAGKIELANKIDKINILRHACTRTRKVDVQDQFKVIRQPKAEFIDLEPGGVEEIFYNTVSSAIKKYSKQANLPSGFLLAMPQRYISSCMAAAVDYWKGSSVEETPRMLNNEIYEVYGTTSIENDVKTTHDEEKLLDYLKREVLPGVDAGELERVDSKFSRLLEVVDEILSENKYEKIIIFSYFKATLHYLSRRLNDEGISTQLLMGGMRENKYEVIQKFKKNKDINILMCSEVASEGVDLQFCRVLINYDLPWNPMKIEQRIGRIDRIGQKHPTVTIWNLFHRDTIDERIYRRLLDRLKIFERAMGGVNDVVGEEINKLTRELTNELIFGDLTEEQEEQKFYEASLAIEQNRLTEQEVEAEASSLIAHGGYILDQVQAAYNFQRRITNDDLKFYVDNFLGRFAEGSTMTSFNSEDIFEIKPSASLQVEIHEFIEKRNMFGLSHITDRNSIRVKFDNKRKAHDPNIEFIDQFHPLIRFISYKLESIRREKNNLSSKLVAIIVDNIHFNGINIDKGTYYFAMNKWSFSGLRTEEELKVRLIDKQTEKLFDLDAAWDVISILRLHGKSWLQNKKENMETVKSMIEKCIVELDSDFERAKNNRDIENEDRIQFQIDSAENSNKRKLKSLNQAIESLKSKDVNHSMIRPTEGRIEKQSQRHKLKLDSLRAQKELIASSDEVCVGIFQVI